MRSEHEIAEMIDRLEANVAEHGWDAAVSAASFALQWAAGNSGPGHEMFRRWMERPEKDRFEDWRKLGGDPADWTHEKDAE